MEVPRCLAVPGHVQEGFCQMPRGTSGGLAIQQWQALGRGGGWQAWASAGALCTAPGTYHGICSAAMDFTTYTKEDKMHWSTLCGVAWHEPVWWWWFRRASSAFLVCTQALPSLSVWIPWGRACHDKLLRRRCA